MSWGKFIGTVGLFGAYDRKLYITEADFDKKAFERLYKLNII